jgi:membrane protease YdiL (CAAX protease family)
VGSENSLQIPDATTMTTPGYAPSFWTKLPITLRAVVAGFIIAAAAANVWLLLLLNLGVRLAAVIEAIFLGLFIWWARGGGPPRAARAARAKAFRRGKLTSKQWLWGLIAAFFLAVTVHASIVLLFRLVSYPAAAFRQGYDLSFIPSQALRWVVVVVSAASAGICEEIGFRGFMQQPIEQRHGASVAVLISSLFFLGMHLSKAWSSLEMVPIVFGAGVLLGLLAWSAGSLIPGIIGHFVMDVGLFAYWWTGIAGNFTARPITETGVDRSLFITCCVFAISLVVVLLAMWRLRRAAPARDLARSA